MIGETVSHYRILEKIGEGGMGIVYKARDTKIDRDVALKFLPSGLVSHEPERARFLQEARAAGALNHPNICTIYDIVTEGDTYFIVMEYVDGQTLRELIAKGPLSIDTSIGYAVQIGEALHEAHTHGIVHRDIKPENIMVNSKNQVKVMDFGLAKLKGAVHLTRTTTTVGTAAYMSPEQARGEELDERTDIWSMGVVVYQMLTGRLPFRGEHEAAMSYSIVHEEYQPILKLRSDIPVDLVEIIDKMLRKDVRERYQTTSSVVQDLRGWLAAKEGIVRPRQILKKLKRPAVAIPAVVVLCALVATCVWFFSHQAKVRWAREELLPKIDQLVEAGRDNYVEAYKLAAEAEKYLPDDQKLAESLSKIAVTISVKTEPSGAKVYMKEYKAPESDWDYLGVSPIDKIRLPLGFFEFKMEKEMYETVFAVSSTFELDWKLEKLYTPKDIVRVLDKKGDIQSGMVRVKGDRVKNIGELDDFFIDKYEVTNKQFKEFVDKDGYRKKEYWKEKFINNGKELTWEEAVKEFVDQTGISGPATWQAGDYPEGQDSFPVNGISWYEAAAYARFAGKSLPTVYHWGIAARGGISSSLLSRGFYTFLAPMSNFSGKGPAPVGSNPGMTSYGAYDMAGNVREWCWNESPKGRIIRGGGWNDATYMFSAWSQGSAFDRSPKNGFRCALYPDPGKIPKSTFASAKMGEVPDLYKEKPVSNSIFQIYKEQFLYDKKDLGARVEWKNESSKDWIQEKISFNAAYENERVIAYLFLPPKTTPPYQTVIYFPGSGSISQKTSRDMDRYWEFDARLSLLVKNGRAVLYPIYKGTFERGDDALTEADENSHLYSEFLIKLVKDFKRCIDYLETRPDIDSKKLAYFGFSWGGNMGAIIPAVEDRIKASILGVGGLSGTGRPEANDVNYVSRVKIPTLMLNGRYDMAFPFETSVKPMFDLLGTPKEDKQLKVYDTDHFIPRNEFTREALSWLDRYLGPVR